MPATGLGAKQKSAVLGSAVADIRAPPVRDARDWLTRIVVAMLELEHTIWVIAVIGRERCRGRSLGEVPRQLDRAGVRHELLVTVLAAGCLPVTDFRVLGMAVPFIRPGRAIARTS